MRGEGRVDVVECQKTKDRVEHEPHWGPSLKHVGYRQCKGYSPAIELTDQQQRWLDALAEGGRGGRVRLVFTRKGPRWALDLGETDTPT